MTTYNKLAAIEADYELFPKAATPLTLPSLVNSGRLTSAAASAGATNARKQIIIGEDFETHLPVTLTDKEREGGVYILGEPRKGKSTLMVSMAIQDINNGHGLLFIDPHYDAINNLLARIPKSRLDDVILLDPSDKNRSFALNVLHCPDPDDAIEPAPASPLKSIKEGYLISARILQDIGLLIAALFSGYATAQAIVIRFPHGETSPGLTRVFSRRI